MKENNGQREGPLNGAVVLNFSRMAPGPFAARLLADLGADVIMVEPPGDDVQNPPSFLAPRVRAAGNHPPYRGVQSVVCDLKTPEGHSTALDLSSTADILIESFRPGVMKRLALDYATVASHVPSIIYASLTGFGQDTPLSNFRAHDIDFLAEAGILSTTNRKGRRPEVPLNILGDYAAGGLYAAYSILIAMMTRAQTGLGSYLDLSIVENLEHLLEPARSWWQTGYEGSDSSFFTGACPFYDAYQTRDLAWFTISAVETTSFAAMIRATGLERHAKHRSVESQWPALRKSLEEWASTRTITEAITELRENDVPAGEVKDLKTVLGRIANPQECKPWPHPQYFKTQTERAGAYSREPGENEVRQQEVNND